MVVGEFLGYSSLGGAAYKRSTHSPVRNAITLDAKRDPQTPNQYSVHIAPDVVIPPQKAANTQPPEKRLHQNNDPVSRVFIGVANFAQTIHKIDIKV